MHLRVNNYSSIGMKPATNKDLRLKGRRFFFLPLYNAGII
jgi:hypothetical protein